MGDLTRLDFMKSSAKAAAGATVIGTLAVPAADAHEGPVGSEPVVAYVKDPAKGEISVMSGDREVTVNDRALAAKLSRAAG
jgi:hypothetical protein